MLKPGDRVVIRISGTVSTVPGPGIVKLVSPGGTVVLKSAILGRRCFEEQELEKVDAENHQG